MRESLAQKVERESRQREWSSDTLFIGNKMDPTRSCKKCLGPIAFRNKSGYCGECWWKLRHLFRGGVAGR